MNKITYKLAIWYLGYMMKKANKLLERIEKLGFNISKYEKSTFKNINE